MTLKDWFQSAWLIEHQTSPQEIADLVTEMREVKHPYQKGILAQRGIEY